LCTASAMPPVHARAQLEARLPNGAELLAFAACKAVCETTGSEFQTEDERSALVRFLVKVIGNVYVMCGPDMATPPAGRALVVEIATTRHNVIVLRSHALSMALSDDALASDLPPLTHLRGLSPHSASLGDVALIVHITRRSEVVARMGLALPRDPGVLYGPAWAGVAAGIRREIELSGSVRLPRATAAALGDPRGCSGCAKTGAQMMRCACGLTWYCDAACQGLHWQQHKEVCKMVCANQLKRDGDPCRNAGGA